jgi:mono/diheme cytochrome c family protein
LSSLLTQRNVAVAFVIVCLLALAIFLVRAGARSGGPSAAQADVANAELVAQGQRLYQTRCASCHGSDLRGEQGWPTPRPNGAMPASPLDASGTAWQHDDQWLFVTIKQGGQATAPPGYTSSMPGFGGGLTDAQIWAVISYIKSTWPSNIQQVQPPSR